TNSSSQASSVLGGKNSKLNVVRCSWKMSRMCMALPAPGVGDVRSVPLKVDCAASTGFCQERVGQARGGAKKFPVRNSPVWTGRVCVDRHAGGIRLITALESLPSLALPLSYPHKGPRERGGLDLNQYQGDWGSGDLDPAIRTMLSLE